MQSSKQWAEELDILASLLSSVPLEKKIKWGADVYTYQNRNVVSYGGFKNFFSLWFYNGVFLKDKYKVLINASEGKTVALRQWRFTSKADINESKILEYIYEAIEIEKKGLKVKTTKFSPFPTPLILSVAFKTNKTFQTAFEKLSPGKQKEYMIYLNEPKQEKTKLSRLEKITPMILQGVGLNDKYK